MIPSTNSSELQKKHFSALQTKYQVIQRNGAAFDSFLYLILRKAELGIQITDLEIQWLAENQLFRTIEIIALQQYQMGERNRLEAEFLQLRTKYHIPAEAELPLYNPVYSLLGKLEAGYSLSNSDLELLKHNGFVDTIALIQETQVFSKLKTKYEVTNCLDQIPQEPLYSLLKTLDAGEKLSDSEVAWLLNRGLKETVVIYLKQEKEKKDQIEFSELKAKYQVDSHSDDLINSPLYRILKQLDAEKELADHECNWLKQQDLIGLFNIDRERKDRRYFLQLKIKYQASQFRDSEPSSYLFYILRLLEISSLKHSNIPLELKELAESKDFQILESDILYLLAQGLHQTAEIAKQIHFKELRAKYRIVGQLAMNPFYEIMLKLERDERLDPKQVIQLIEGGYLAPHGKIAIAHYKLEAAFYEQEYRRTGNRWNLASASSNWRKAEESEKALKATETINWHKVRELDLKSALLVTRGAAFRDLARLDEAESCATQAMECQPDNHQPYTLMGAICYDQGNYPKGDSWFAMAMERGAGDTDDEIEKIVRMTKDKNKRKEVAEYLLKKDAKRYAWATSYLKL